MFERLHLNNLIVVILLLGLAGCNLKAQNSTTTIPQPPVQTSGTASSPTAQATPEGTPAPSPVPSRLFTICLGREPASLFYYDATSTAAQDVLAAVYDGPVDIRNYAAFPVILEKLPSLADGTAVLKPVEVTSGDLIADSTGSLVNLEAGVIYRPSGCNEAACALTYQGDGAVQMDQLVLHFTLLPDIQWSDGTPLQAVDSVYSFGIARSLSPSPLAAVLDQTESYQALDDQTIEWVGVPGFQDGLYQNKFFTPLPVRAWNSYPVPDLRSAELSSRKPMGWGPYVIDEWISGDHITLHKNPLYFRASEDLPRFDYLVFRFVATENEALDALQAGECDLIDRTAITDPHNARLSQLLEANQAKVTYLNDAGWEQLAFGITPQNSQRVSFFTSKEVRQAVALCVDRKALVAGQPVELDLLADSYIPSFHPLYNPQVQRYDFDPSAASALLEAAGWLDTDNDPATPRVSQGAQGVPDGTLFEVDYLVSPDVGEQADAAAIQGSLQGCGIHLQIVTQEAQEYLASGPDGPVFGREFDLAQFAWTAALEPPCSYFLTREIPGPYPEYPKGWGGANAGGYSNPAYDQACQDALYSLPDLTQHKAKHFEAQAIFSQDLPVLPLYLHYAVMLSRTDMCPIGATSALDSALWGLELFDYGGACSQ